MAYATVVKKSVFDSAHRNTGFGEGHKCNRIHGHTFNYEVAVRGKINPDTGLSLDFGALKLIMKEKVDLVLDHYFLNEDVTYFKDVSPSAENIATFIFEQVQTGLYQHAHEFTPDLLNKDVPKVQWVRLDETPTSTVIINKEDFQDE